MGKKQLAHHARAFPIPFSSAARKSGFMLLPAPVPSPPAGSGRCPAAIQATAAAAMQADSVCRRPVHEPYPLTELSSPGGTAAASAWLPLEGLVNATITGERGRLPLLGGPKL